MFKMGVWRLKEVIPAPVRSGKKMVAVFQHRETGREKRTPFGARGYEDYTIHKDAERARRYRQRHQKDLETGDPTRAGFLSYYLLWGTPNFDENLRLYRKKFGV